MAKRRPSSKAGSASGKSANLIVRLEPSEKDAFQLAASLVGQSTSVWLRDKLRKIAQEEIIAAGLPAPFTANGRAHHQKEG